MKQIYFTIAGTRHHFGQDFIEPGMPVRLVKEPDNAVDTEAIRVEMEGLGLVGYVANSPYTVLGESYSAGRLYDKIGDRAAGSVRYVLEKGVLCTLTARQLPPPEEEGEDESEAEAEDDVELPMDVPPDDDAAEEDGEEIGIDWR